MQGAAPVPELRIEWTVPRSILCTGRMYPSGRLRAKRKRRDFIVTIQEIQIWAPQFDSRTERTKNWRKPSVSGAANRARCVEPVVGAYKADAILLVGFLEVEEEVGYKDEWEAGIKRMCQTQKGSASVYEVEALDAPCLELIEG